MKTQRNKTNGDVDWTAVRARLAASAVAAEGALRPSPDVVQRILADRARRLARPLERTRAEIDACSVVSFSLGRERYAVEARYVREVLRLTELAALPRVPNFVIGVTNLHGEVLIVFDLQRFFGFASKGLTDRAHVVVCADERTEFGIVADTVHDVSPLAAADVRGDTIFEGVRGRDCIRGVTSDATLFVDLPTLMRHPELVIGQSKETGAAGAAREAL